MSRSTASKQEQNFHNEVTEIQAKYTKKKQTQNANSEIYFTQVRTELNVPDKKANIYYTPK